MYTIRRLAPVYFAHVLRFVVLGAFFAVMTSCAGGGSSDSSSAEENTDLLPVDGEDSVPGGYLRLTTFNVGLLPHFVPLAAERVSLNQQALGAHDADVLCLQEVWEEQDVNAILSGIVDAYPFVYIEAPRQKTARQVPVCQQEEFEPILLCAAERCIFQGGGFMECVKRECYQRLEDLVSENAECAQAVFAQAGKSIFDLVEIQSILFSGTEAAGLFAFGGSSGLILASKFELSNLQVLDFFNQSTTSRRAALFATITINGRKHYVGCTHLTSNLEGVLPYAGESGSWAQEAQAQAAFMISFAQGYANGGAQYLAGDFNCSIVNPQTGVQSDLANNCNQFLQAGYRDVAAEQLGCSFCSGNLINQSNTNLTVDSDLLLDHIFTKNNPFAEIQAEIVLHERIVVSGQQANLSDHYGIRLAVPIP